MNKRIIWSLAAAAIFAGGPAMAAGQNTGPRMMGGYGPGMMYAAAATTQARPNAAARAGYYGMSHPMMGGYGMGPGMMGGYGMGPGMMGGYGAHALGLSSEQRGKIVDIWNGSISKAWPIMGQLRDQYFRFARLMGEESPDRAAVNKAYTRISDFRRQLLDLRLDARQQMMGVLTADQRKELQQGFYHHWR